MRKSAPENPLKINLWERVNLFLEKGGRRSEFLTRIEDIKHDSIILEMPIRQIGELHLAKGDIVEVTYNRIDAAYSFKASILDLFEGETRSVRISKLSQTKRIQRRRYVRLDISGKMQFRILDFPGSKQVRPGSEIEGTLLNISAGGVLFECRSRVKNNSVLALTFSLKGHHTLNNILAVVKRSEGSRAKGYLVGAEFITKSNYADYNLEKIEEFLPSGCGTFNENLQRLVVQFIYNQQVELRKKGLLHQ
jgi:c-di-GMP-binding flagellar brake protein YcgR